MKPRPLPIPDPPIESAVTRDGCNVYAVKKTALLESGHWLTEEEMKIKFSDFPEDIIFINSIVQGKTNASPI